MSSSIQCVRLRMQHASDLQLELPCGTSLWSGCCTSAGTSCVAQDTAEVFMHCEERPSVPPAPLPDSLCAQYFYMFIAVQHGTSYLHPTCMLHFSVVDSVVFDSRHVINWPSQTFYWDIGVLRHFGQMGFRMCGVKIQTENTFRKHLEPIKHAHNVTKQIRPEKIRTVITSHPYNAALGT